MNRKMIAVALAMVAPLSLHAEEKGARMPNVVIMFIDDLGYGDTGPFGCKDIPTPNIDRLARKGVTCTASYITNPPCSPSRCSMVMGQYGQRFGKYGMARGLAIPENRPNLAEFVRDHGYVTGQIGKWDIGTKAQGPLTQGFLEVAREPTPKHYANLKDAPPALRNKGGESKYFCLTEDGKEAWLTDYNGDRMVEFVELAGVPAPQAMQGKSWVPLLTGKKTGWRSSFLCEYFFESGFEGTPTLVGIRTATEKLVKYPGHPEWTELFDLKADAYETKNLSGEDGDVERRQRMLEEFDRQVKEATEVTPKEPAPLWVRSP